MNRETYLEALVEALRPLLEEHGGKLPKRIHVSCGWPSRAALSRSRRRIGECWYPESSEGKVHELFVSPSLSDPIKVAGVVAHELVHVAVGKDAGHKAPFKRLATAIGLTGKMTATEEGPEFVAAVRPILQELGKYPHRTLTGANHKKQSTRLIKLECEDCGCIVRITRKWLDEAGPPTCGCLSEEPMREAS